MIAKTTACGCVLAAVLCSGCRNTAPAPARTSAAELRESAYRANNRGVALMERSSYGEAIAAFREALTTDPALRLARINLAIGLFYAGQPQDAAREAEEARRDYPEAPQPLYLLGLIARSENRPDTARDAFVRVLTLDPADAGAKLNLAMVHLEQGRFAEAAALCRSVLADEPYNATAAYNLALALNRDGDARGGAVAMRRFEQLRNAPYAVTLSQTYLEQGRYAEAIASTGVEPDLVNASPPRVAFVDATDAIGIGSTNRRPAGAMPPVPLAGGVTLADIDADGDLDVLASGLALTVWRNDRGHLVDATAGMGFSGMPPDVTGAIAGDVNNDDRADVIALTQFRRRRTGACRGAGRCRSRRRSGSLRWGARRRREPSVPQQRQRHLGRCRTHRGCGPVISGCRSGADGLRQPPRCGPAHDPPWRRAAGVPQPAKRHLPGRRTRRDVRRRRRLHVRRRG